MYHRFSFVLIRSLLLALLFLALLFWVAPVSLRAQTQPPDPQAAAHRARAKGLAEKSEYTAAIAEYQQAYALDNSLHLEDATLDLNKIGGCYISLRQYSRALDSFKQELALDQKIKYKSDEAKTLSNIGLIYNELSQYGQALESYQAALPIQKAIGDSLGEMMALQGIGRAYRHLGQYGQALDFYQQALPLQKQNGDRAGEAVTLSTIGAVCEDSNQYEKALNFYQQTLAINHQIGDKAAEVLALNSIGRVYGRLSQTAKALDYYQQAALIVQQIGDKAGEAAILTSMGGVYGRLGQYFKEFDLYQQSLLLQRQIGDKKGEARTLNDIGLVCANLSQYTKALEFYQQVLSLLPEVGDRAGEASTLNNIGSVYTSLSQYSKSLGFYQQSLLIRRQIGDKEGEATTLNNIARVYDLLGQYAMALDIYQRVLPIERQIGNKAYEAMVLNNIGEIYISLSEYATALNYLQQALPIQQQIKSRAGEATTLGNIGEVYNDLSQYEKALDHFQQALLILAQIGDKVGEAVMLSNIGGIFDSVGNYTKALDLYQQALSIQHEIGGKTNEAGTLGNIGLVYHHLRQYKKALDLYQQVLSKQHQIGDEPGEATTLSDIGGVYEDLGQYVKALDFYQQSILTQRQIGDKNGEATTLNNIMSTLTFLKQPGVAIFYGKQAVNVRQIVRRNLSALDQESRNSYTSANTKPYQALADLLISQGRLTEAQKVLRLLKEREFFDFLNPDSNTLLPTMDSMVLTKREAHWAAAYNRAANPLTVLGTQEQSLHLKKNRTPAEDAQHVKLQAQIANAAVVLQHVQKQITTAFSGPQSADDRLPRTTGGQELQQALPPGTVALYTIVAPDRLNLILITPRGQKAYTSAITADTLYQNVLALRRALTNPDVDPTGPAAVLYHLVLEPVQKDLDAAGAKTILFSLDDALRYIPPAALYNPQTKQYIAERYRTELITLAGARPATTPASNLRILGLGVSTSQDGAPALPGVAMELTAIVHEPGDAGGLVPGRRLMDSDFTQLALEERLKTAGYPLVHLASHFALHATQDTSYLLLGDGSHLTVADLAKDPHRFRGVELLTLSACQTAMEVRGSAGREVEGVGALAQTLGAGSVLASLWPVSDAATPPLMTALYGYRQQHPTAPLAEALQAAQLYLLHKPMPASADTVHRGTEAVLSSGDSGNLPSFGFDPKAPYAHPFYWAPFILIGNWR